jgi:FKBP-type peptidyl-prolyl cis-trans isomerase
MARRTTKPAKEGEVQAHLGEGARSRALQRLCEGSAADSHLCSETELAFMKDTVINLGNGVKYKVIDNGTGRSPTADDNVIVRYSGLLPDGTEFGSADASGEAEAFRLNQAIPGLREVLQYMEEGAKWEVYVPTEMAFPEPGPWGGQEVLFRIELLAVGDDAGSSAAEAPDDARRVSERQSDEHTYWQMNAGPDGAAAAQEAETNAELVASPNPRVAAETFLEQVGAQEDVVSLPSGLRYKVLKSGDGSGRSPTATDTVVVKYRTMLPDGREIGRSPDAATPLKMNKLLPGWQEALQHMKEGAQWELYMPPSLASRGTRRRGVAGMQPLICQLELVSISQAADTTADR